MAKRSVCTAVAIGVLLGLTQVSSGQTGDAANSDGTANTTQEHTTPQVVRSGAAWSWQRYGGVFGSTQYEVTGLVELVAHESGRHELRTDTIRINEDGRYSVYLSTRAPDKIEVKQKPTSRKLGTIGTRSGARSWEIDAANINRLRSIVVWHDEERRVAGILELTAGQVIAHSHAWGKAQKKTSGSWEIVSRDDGMYFRTSSNFKTARPPEPLGLLLTTRAASTITKRNAEAGAFRVATLESHQGAQEIRLPDDVTLSDYNALVLWCKPYEVVFGVSDLANTKEQ